MKFRRANRNRLGFKQSLPTLNNQYQSSQTARLRTQNIAGKKVRE